jgi:RNA polymerase sigma-70 factor (ECF subfamily)
MYLWTGPAIPPTPDQEASHHQDLDRIEAALKALPPETRLAVEMHRFGEYRLHEVADRLGVSVPTAHRIVRDALVGLARSLGRPPTEPTQ